MICRRILGRSAPLRAEITPSSTPCSPAVQWRGIALLLTTISHRKRAKGAWAVDGKRVWLREKRSCCFFLSLAKSLPSRKSWPPCLGGVKDGATHGGTHSVRSCKAPWDTPNGSPSAIPSIWNTCERWVSRSTASLRERNVLCTVPRILSSTRTTRVVKKNASREKHPHDRWGRSLGAVSERHLGRACPCHTYW